MPFKTFKSKPAGALNWDVRTAEGPGELKSLLTIMAAEGWFIRHVLAMEAGFAVVAFKYLDSQ